MKLKKRLEEPLSGLFGFLFLFCFALPKKLEVSVSDGFNKQLNVLKQKVQIYVLVLIFAVSAVL